MTGKAKDKREEIVRTLLPHAEEPLREELARETVSRRQMRKMVGLLEDAFEELIEPDGMMNICKKRVREWVREGFEIDAAPKTADPLLDKAVEIVRENIVKKSERDALAKHLSEELIEDWQKLPKETLEAVGGEDGLLSKLSTALEEEKDLDGDVIVDAILKMYALLAPQTLRRLSDKQVDRLLGEGIEIMKKVEKKKSFWEPALDWVTYGMTHLGIIKIMRKSFARLLLGDLILHSVGKGLGLKKKTTVTDFIILVGVRVAEKIVLDEADPAGVRELREKLEKIQ